METKKEDAGPARTNCRFYFTKFSFVKYGVSIFYQSPTEDLNLSYKIRTRKYNIILYYVLIL